MTFKLFSAALIAAMGGLLFGFDTAVISGAEGTLESLYGLNSFWHGVLVSSALIGTVIGAMVVGIPADALGRRKVLFGIAVFYFVSAVGSALAWDSYSFMFFRFLGGLAVGGASVVSPMYTAEISPARFRGRLVALTQFNIVLGILLAFLSNYLIAQCNLGEIEWRWMFGVEAFPAFAFFFLLVLTPRSPRWLISKGRVDEARGVFESLGAIDTDTVDEEIEEIQASLDLAHHSMREPFFRKAYLKPILLVVAIAMFNQLSGINALMYYAVRIFKMTGATGDVALLSSVAVGFTNLVFTMAALLIIDHFGRKRLMLVGSIGYIISLSVTAWAFFAFGAQTLGKDGKTMETVLSDPGGTIVLISLLVFIASHAFGQGAVIWVFISEIFPNRLRARGQALGSSTHWIMAAAISTTFPMFAEASGGFTFAFYAACMVLQLGWVIFIMPETKGVPLEKIQQEMGIE
ncbi:MAG: sugar porter family MFS transporter [Thermoguttaceae bacterium]